jgi:ribosomal protein S18 acetylase RimI-like enzyme
MTKITVVEALAPEIKVKMENDLVAYEAEHGIDVNYKRFSLVMTDDLEEVIGAINAYTVFSEVYIDEVWVDGGHRRKGLGQQLIMEMERLFKGKGFNNMNLVTNEFQAAGFYEKCGFVLEFTRKNVQNPKLTKFFFAKYFDDAVQMQGLLNVGEA